MKSKFTHQELACWLACLWALRGISKVKIDHEFHDRLEKAFSDVEKRLHHWRRPNFCIFCDPLHDGSETLGDMMQWIIVLNLGHCIDPFDGFIYLDVSDEVALYLLDKSLEPIGRRILQPLVETALIPRP